MAALLAQAALVPLPTAAVACDIRSEIGMDQLSYDRAQRAQEGAGYRLTRERIDDDAGRPRFAALWVRNGRPFRVSSGAHGVDAFYIASLKMTVQDYRLVDLIVGVVSGSPYFSALWEKDQPLRQTVDYWLTQTELRRKIAQPKQRVLAIAPYRIGKFRYFAALFDVADGAVSSASIGLNAPVIARRDRQWRSRGYQRYTISQQLDDDQTGNAPVAGGQTFKQVILSDEKTEGVTQELRLTSPLWGPVDFVAGLYYFDASVLQTSSNARRRVAVPQNQFSTFTSKTSFLNYAAFGQINLHPLEGLTVLLGGRFTHDKVDNLYIRVDDPVAPFRSGNTNYNLGQSSDDFSYKAGLQYKAARDAFFYATYSQGYKGPGFNVASNGTLADPPLRPETSESYEVGTKVKLFDRRISLNIALFDARYRDFAVTAVDTVTNSVRLVNAATLKTRGVEVEGELRPVRGLSITGAVGYIDSAITVLGTPCYDLQTAATGCTVRPVVGRLQDVVDGAVPNAARWKWNVGASWEIPVGGFNVTPRANYSWTGRQQFLLNQNPDGIQGGFGILDAGIGFSTQDNRYAVELFVKNALDRFYVNSVGNVSDLPGSTFSFIPRDAGRYFGLRLSARL